MYGLTLVLALIITGGAIAYIGDRIGRKVGRRRLSIFGLRPRHTSIVITIITGIIVSTTTLVVLSIVSRDVRTALFHMREIELALTNTRQALSSTVSRLKDQESELKKREKTAQELRGQIQLLTGQIDELSARMKIKAAEYDLLTARNASLTSELERVIKERRAAEELLMTVRGKLGALEKEYQSMSDQYATTKGNYEEAQEKLRSSEERIAKLTQLEKDLQAKISSLEDERKKLEDETMTLQTRIKVLTQGANWLYSELQNMSGYLEGLSLSNLVFRADEIILATVLEGGKPLKDVENDVYSFLVRANRVAYEKGARIEGSDTDAIIWFTDNLTSTYNRIHETKGKVVVRLVSAINTVAGQPVYAYLQVFENKRIFEKGQVIAKRVIDGSKGPDKVQDEMMMLLMDVNSEAIKQGMISDAAGRVGQVTDWELRSAKSEVLAAGKPMEVMAIALEDTWNAQGPLRVKFVVSESRGDHVAGSRSGR